MLICVYICGMINIYGINKVVIFLICGKFEINNLVCYIVNYKYYLIFLLNSLFVIIYINF